METFTIDNMRIPLPDNSIDVVITCHAIESNRKSMKSIIKELYRVSKLGLCLMEPHYEIGNSYQKKEWIILDILRTSLISSKTKI